MTGRNVKSLNVLSIIKNFIKSLLHLKEVTQRKKKVEMRKEEKVRKKIKLFQATTA